MGEENKPLFGPLDKIYFCDYDSLKFNELPIVKDSVKLEQHDNYPIWMSQNTFDAIMANPAAVEFFWNPILERANKMLESIKEDIEMFYSLKPPQNRKERRERANALKKRIIAFKAFCKNHAIDINIR